MAFVVFAGQSNALGFGMTRATLPAEYDRGIDWLTWIWRHDLGWYEPLMPGHNTGTAAHPEAWGPEVAFAHAFRAAHPEEPLLIVKTVKGSTGLAETPNGLDWSPRSEGEMFERTAARISAALDFVNYTRVDVVFLIQGETDGTDPAWAAAYEANLREFIAALRSEWMHDPDGDVVLGRVADSTPYWETVRWAQHVVDRDDPSVSSFDTHDYEFQTDLMHYTSGGMIQAGHMFYGLWTGMDLL